MSEASLIEFYRRFGISPVRQDISDLQRHFSRRRGLYRQLGILPALVCGRSVVEIGPGSGYNSLYTASLHPSRYVLVEANPRGVTDIRALFGSHGSVGELVEIVPSLVENYTPDLPFDVVLCEGMLALAGVPHPEVLLATVARLVAPNGVLVITCIDAVSYLAETLRRLLGDLLISPAETLQHRTVELVAAFGPHLQTIAGMSRSHEDWVVDSLINPASIGPLLSVTDAIAALDAEFDVFGSSPHFITDWRWYKDIGVDGRFNDLAMKQYWANLHSFLDYRHVFPPGAVDRNTRLHDASLALRATVNVFEQSGERAHLAALPMQLRQIGALIGDWAPDVKQALSDVERLLGLPRLSAKDIASAQHLAPWFGRGQQYLSFSRRAT